LMSSLQEQKIQKLKDKFGSEFNLNKVGKMK
jgi:hypothetical protein